MSQETKWNMFSNILLIPFQSVSTFCDLTDTLLFTLLFNAIVQQTICCCKLEVYKCIFVEAVLLWQSHTLMSMYFIGLNQPPTHKPAITDIFGSREKLGTLYWHIHPFLHSSIYPSIHLSIHCHLSGVGSWWQGVSDVCLPSNTFQLLLGESWGIPRPDRLYSPSN